MNFKNLNRYFYVVTLLLISVANANATNPGVCFKIYDASGAENYHFELGEYLKFDASCTSLNLADDHRAWFVPPFTAEPNPDQSVSPFTPCYVGVWQPNLADNVYYYFHNTRECPFYTGSSAFSTSYFKEGTYVMQLDMTDEQYRHNGTSPVLSSYTMSKQFTVGRAGSATCLEDGYNYCKPIDGANLAWLVPVISLLLN